MTHNERVLRLLKDGKPHTHHELYALHVIAHSRIADLRKQGYEIDQWTERTRNGRVYVYQLSGPPSSTRSGPETPGEPATNGEHLVPPVGIQLALGDAA